MSNKQTKATTTTQNTNGKKPTFRMIAPSLIIPSETNPRSFFDKESLNELANSIKQRGVLQALLVKPSKTKEGLFELIAGERRWRASKIARLELIPCLVVEMSEEETLDAQIIENLQRAEVHPLDEARSYLHLLETIKIEVAELARRVGKSDSYVARRLQLVHLIDEAQEDYKQGLIDLGHALEIARLDAKIQPLALAACYETVWTGEGRVPDKTRPCKHVKEIQNWIESNVLLSLKRSPFKLDDTRLRDDNLTCIECPQRTGFNRGLFADISDDDTCTNPICWKEKTTRLVQIKREEISEKVNARMVQKRNAAAKDKVDAATEEGNKGKTGDVQSGEQTKEEQREEPYKAPLLTHYFSRSSGMPEEALLIRSYEVIEKRADRCQYAEQGVYCHGQATGKVVWICREPTCKDHLARYNRGSSNSLLSTSGSSSTKPTNEEEAAIQRGERRQELFNVKVAEATRQKVFKESLTKFTWPLDRTYYNRIAAEFFVRIPNSDSKVILAVLGRDDLPTSHHDIKKLISKLEAMTDDELARFMLLCSIAHYGQNNYGNRFVDQKQVIEFAKEADVDYRLIDAEVRVELSPKKHKWDAERYLNEIKSGKDRPTKAEVWESAGQQQRHKKYSGAQELKPGKTQAQKKAA